MTNVLFENPLNIQRASTRRMEIKEGVRELLKEHLGGESAKILFIDGRTLRFASPKDTLTILVNSQPDAIKSELDVSEQTFFDNYVGIKRLMQGANPAYMAIKDTNGFDIAYYDHRHHDLYIPFDIFDLSDDTYAMDVLNIVLQCAFMKIHEIKNEQYLWGGTNAEAVRKNLQRLAKDADENTPDRLERKVSEYQEYERDARQKLRNHIQSVQRYMRELETAQKYGSTLDAKIAKDFDALLQHEDVERIEIRDGRLVVCTNNIIGTTDKGDRYRFGKFRIEHRLGNTGIKFFGDTPRKGYWSSEDPHPHVAKSGEPCLGNIGEAIAQMSSQHEYMALFTIAIEFLKSANTEDSAGNNAHHWDLVEAGAE